MRAPAVFPALTVIGGIAAGVSAPDWRTPAVVLLLASVAIAGLAWHLRGERVFAAALLGGFVAAGVVFGAIASPSGARSPLRAFFDDLNALPRGPHWPLVVEGRLRTDATPTDYGASVVLDVERIRTPCGWMPAPGGARLAINGTLAERSIHAWREGRRVRAPVTLRLPTTYRNPGVPDEELALARRGIALVGSVKSGSLVEMVSPGNPAQEAAASARAYVRDAIRASIPARPMAASIVIAILIGDRGGLDPATRRRLQEAGTYHVIAISGGNIAILAAIGYVLLRAARVPARPGALALTLLLCTYGYVAGGGPSVARATAAAAVYLLAVAADHRSPSANVLGTVALVAVVYSPLEVFDPGLGLSYGATLALLIIATKSGESRDGRGSRAAESTGSPGALRVLRGLGTLCVSASSASRAILLGTVAAELALFPIGAYVFHRITIAGLLVNFAAIPLMVVAQVAGLAVLVVTPLSTALAALIGEIAGLAAIGLTESTRLLDVAPWLTWRVPSPPIWIAALYYAGWICLLWCPVPVRFKRVALLLSAAAASVICIPVLAHRTHPQARVARGEFRVTFLDVGQGDAVLLQFPGGRSMLVDAAGLQGASFDIGERVITPALLALGVSRLEYLAITHGDPDHVAGAASVARDFRPRELWEGIAVPPHAALRELQSVVVSRGGALRTVRPDDRLHVGGVELRVLHPGEPDWERQRVRNDDSIVIEARFGDVSFVLPGDVGAGVEERLASRLSDAPLRVLKAAHHGSATSSGAAWLAASRPAAVIFSCGRGNRYGHPHPSVLARVQETGADVFRTDQDGAVTVTTDGRQVRIAVFTERLTLSGTKTTEITKTTKETTHKATKEDQYGAASRDHAAR